MRNTWGTLAAMLSAVVTALGQPVPDFKLLDVNLSSARRGAPVSPRDYAFQVSGYYFGAAG